MSSYNHIYIALFKGTGFFSRLIQKYTRSEYSHAALVFPITTPNTGTLLCIEALEGKGVIKTNNWIKPNNCELFRIECTEQQYYTMRNFALDQVGKKYDWATIFGFVLRRNQESRKSKEQWICSELVFSDVQVKGGIKLFSNTVEPFKVSPGLLRMSPVLP